MKSGSKTILKYVIYGIAAAFAIFLIFILSLAAQFMHYSVADVIGWTAWNIIYIFGPVPVLIFAVLIAVYNRKRKLKITIAATTVLICVYAGVTLGTVAGVNQYFETFSQDKWNKYDEERYLMLDDLKSKYDFMGMTHDEVSNLLGEPNTPYADVEGADIMEYLIDRGYIDPIMLTFVFEDGKVADVYTYSEYRSTARSIY